MSQPRATFMPDLLVEHFEELGFLWGQRRAALRSANTTLRALRTLEERIAAHVEGLMAGGQNSVGVVEGGLVSESANEAFAAAYTLLSLNDAKAADKVLKAFLEPAGEGALRGVCEALCVSSVDGLRAELEGALQTAVPVVALAAQEVFAFHWAAKLSAAGIRGHLVDPDPVLRAAAWRAACLRPELVTAQQTEAAVSDKDAAVRSCALEVAAWSGHGWLLEHCRKAVISPVVEKVEELRLLCVLGTDVDAPGILSLAAKKGFGAHRFQLLGAFAQADAIERLIEGMNDPDPKSAAAAGTAFTRITGHELQTTRRVIPPADGSAPDAFEEQFLEEVELPDAREAVEYWEANQSKFQPGQWYSQGLVVPEAPPFSEALDIVSVREACLRAAYCGKPAPRAVEFERFPLSL